MRTWNKAKRKIPTDFNKGRKELFHALRYLHFAIQLAKQVCGKWILLISRAR